MAVSVRLRFEIFKRDKFQCRYCGQSSPAVVLELDHVVPVSEGGGDDVVNLVTSCWSCNRGKSDIPLSAIVTGEDPHDAAVALLESQRQIKEYDALLRSDRERREDIAQQLLNWWADESGSPSVPQRHFRWLVNQLHVLPAEWVRECMGIAIDRGKTADWRYLMAIVRNHREDVA